ncbi:DUF3857 domain-containing protein [Mucilaginibacter sp. PAMB04168]|uniref:transglutaminase domain-containing protein n=1 Tax=Mucilaginibacter sp. PAMB04168 TaxID=3138567 RepID=UPI0031F7074B
MRKLLLLLVIAALACKPAFSEDFPYGNYKLDDMSMKSYAKDPTANAVVLQEFGKSWISSNDGLPLIHEYHVKIKIFNSKAFDEGNVTIPIYKYDNNSFQRVRDIEGMTFYTDEQGMVQRSVLDNKKVIIENRNKYWDLVKFAMPNLREGCVIEYKYTLESPNPLTFRDWDFQSSIPKIYSEYEARIPAYFNFKATLRGPYKLTKNSGDIDRDCFQVRGNKCDCSKLVFVMADLPAFIKEDHMTAPKNFMSAINFELSDYINPYDGTKQSKTQTWADIDRYLKQQDEFGSQLRKTSLFKEKLPEMIAGKTDDLAKAKAIYVYIQKHIKHNNYTGIWSLNGIRKTLETRSGSIGDINLSLVVALNAAGIKTEAVLLSTRENGVVNKLYPVVSDFNYVVAKANIGENSYLLDATDAQLPFGLLPIECINDQGRVISLDKPSYWIGLKASQKRGQTYLMDLTLQPTGKLTGKITQYSLGYEALEKRKAIKKFNSLDEYVENLDEKMPKIKILKSNITNLDSLDLPLSEVYEVEMNLYNDLNASRLTFNPFIFNRFTENPFKLAERTYPVDWGAPFESRVVLTMHLPADFTVETPPQQLSVGLPNTGGQFITDYNNDKNVLTFSHVIKLNQSIYSSAEYPYLKELFNKIIQTEKADIVFKKQ